MKTILSNEINVLLKESEPQRYIIHWMTRTKRIWKKEREQKPTKAQRTSSDKLQNKLFSSRGAFGREKKREIFKKKEANLRQTSERYQTIDNVF